MTTATAPGQHPCAAPGRSRRSASAPRHTLAVLAVALCLRLLTCAFAIHHFGAAWFFHRGTEMGFVARCLLSGHGFGSPFGPATGPTALIAPGYPLLVAAIFRCAGMFTQMSAVLLMTINALLNTLSVYTVLLCARRIASERAAVLAALIPACAPPLLWMPTIFWETNFSATLLLGCIALAAGIPAGSHGLRWSALGALFGTAALVIPALLPTLIVIGLCTAWTLRQGPTRNPLVAILGFTLVYAAWPIRNQLALHAFVPTRTTVGLELWMGNRDGATGFLDESRFPTFNAAELAHYEASGEIRYMAEKSSAARSWILRHPRPFARLSLLRIVRFWCGTGTRHGSMAYAIYAGLTTLGAMLGICVLRGRMDHRRLLACMLAAMSIFPLPYYLTHAEFRYRLVLDPVLCVLSAAAIDWLARSLAIKRH